MEADVGEAREEPRPQEVGLERIRCPKCAAAPRFIQSLLNPRTGKTARLFTCTCGERVWREGPWGG
jgi:hypothetical protein